MKHSRHSLKISIFLLTTAALLSACGGSGSSSGSNSSQPKNGQISLAITDAPVDNAAKVVVSFNGVTLKPANGEEIEFLFDEAKNIDLLQLQGNAYAMLLNNETVPAGSYAWMRLHVNAEQDNILDSYLELNDGTQQELWIPSGSQTGLKLVSGFTVPAGGMADFTIDFDLRKSVTDPKGMPNAILRPTLKLIDNVSVGSISGMIDTDLVNSACADPTVDDGSVYVYEGANVTPVDVQGAETDPISSALVKAEDGMYVYEVGFLPAGDYTVAYTCDAAMDDPEAVDDITFVATDTVSVEVGLPSVVDLPPAESSSSTSSSSSSSASDASSSEPSASSSSSSDGAVQA